MSAERPPLTLTEPLLDAHAVGALLGVEADPSTDGCGWERLGETPCYRIGPRCLRWTRPLLEEWLVSRLDQARS